MEQFLEDLESELMVLEEDERKKILKRYQKQIEERKKEGMSEQEVIESLGSLETIVSEIYSEYHLNKRNCSRKRTFRGSMNHGIHKCADFLSDTCTEIVYYITHISNQSLETFFEILLKIILLIIAFLILKIPFLLFQSLCDFVCTFLFYPFDSILSWLSEFVLAVIYFIMCISLSIAMFKGYTIPHIAKNSKKEKEPTKKVKSSESTKNYAFILLKAIIYIVVIIPMIFLCFLFLILTALAFFFIYKGVSIIGLAIILIGLFFLSLIITIYITDALDNRNRTHTSAMIVSVVVLISGAILFVDNIMNFKYPKTLENSAFKPVTDSLTLEIEDSFKITNLNGNIDFVIDNDIKDGEMLIELSYYDELYDVRLEKYQKDNYLLIYSKRDKFEVSDIQYFYQNGFKDLKNGSIYNYQKLDGVQVTIYGNEKTKSLLDFRGKEA